MSRLPLCVLVAGSFVAGCLPVDPSKSNGNGEGGAGGSFQQPPPSSGTGGMPSTPPTAMPPRPPTGAVVDAGPMGINPQSCDSVKTEALRVLKSNCAACHQNPANQANFSFVLDVDMLAMAVSSTGKRFVVPGYPEQSRLFERVANGEMPPAIVAQRPTANDVAALRAWISGCIAVGSGGFGRLDAGAPDVVGEPPADPCASNNACPNGGCCVGGYCRPNGRPCTSPAGGDNIAGMCTNGSCVAPGAPPCGNLNQACCGVIKICTAASTVCQPGGSTCQPCGKMGARCCQVGGGANCDPGLGCVVMATGDPGTCKPCGGRGQDCCGLGLRRTCNNGLTCQFVSGAKFVCDTAGGQQPPPPDAGRPGRG
jgi:Planctomycete cytochrome C